MPSSGQPTTYSAVVIACGRISRAHARGYMAIPNIELVVCADISSEALRRFGSEFSVRPVWEGDMSFIQRSGFGWRAERDTAS